MDEKLLILLGIGAIGILAATNFNDDDDDDDIEQEQPCHHRNYDNIFVQQPRENFNSISYSPKIDITDVSPLNYGQMVQENFSSDYIGLKEYGDNPDQIPVYDEKSGNVGLPVSDMTDIGAGEDNKYIYDRTIGSIGFTSTKIGGRRRGQADYIRGDLPILPDRSPWFQVSPDINNVLLDGALGNQNSLGGQAPPTPTAPPAPSASSSSGDKKKPRMQAMRTVVNEQTGQVIGQCDDEKADYIDCVYDTFKKSGRQPTMNELKRMYSLQQETKNKKYGGY